MAFTPRALDMAKSLEGWGNLSIKVLESKFPFLQTEFQSQKQALEIEPSSACFFYENILLKVG